MLDIEVLSMSVELKAFKEVVTELHEGKPVR